MQESGDFCTVIYFLVIHVLFMGSQKFKKKKVSVFLSGKKNTKQLQLNVQYASTACQLVMFERCGFQNTCN